MHLYTKTTTGKFLTTEGVDRNVTAAATSIEPSKQCVQNHVGIELSGLSTRRGSSRISHVSLRNIRTSWMLSTRISFHHAPLAFETIVESDGLGG